MGPDQAADKHSGSSPVAAFLAFQGQSWHTDDRTGQPV
jgi:uncharacterized protein YukJ